MKFWQRQQTPLLAGLVWLISLLLYAGTTAPSIVEFFDDSLEFQLVGPTLGIAHPTGYPLYTLLGALWSRMVFPIGNWAWRMNILSVLTAASTVPFVFLCVHRLTTSSRSGEQNSSSWDALIATTAFALSPVWWSQATIAEVYALHNLFVAAILFVTLHLTPSSCHCVTLPFYRLIILSLLLGLSLAHHRTTILLIPGLLLYFYWTIPDVWHLGRRWIALLASFLLPLLLYVYIPIRATMGVQDLNGSYQNTLRGFWNHAVLPAYTSFFQENALAVTYTVADWLALFHQQVGFVGLALALIGLGQLVLTGRGHHTGWWLILIVFSTNLLFAVNYRVPDVEVFLLPAVLCLALLVGGGVDVLYSSLRHYTTTRHMPTVTVALLLLIIAAGPLLRNTLVNRSHDWDAHDRAVAMAKVAFPPNSRVIGLEGEATALKYMQQAEGLGLNAAAVFARNNDERVRAALVDEFLAAGYPVYLTRELPGIETRYSFSGEGPLVRVWPRGMAQIDPPQHSLDVLMADGALRLEGYDLDILKEAGGPTMRLGLYWRPVQTLPQRLKVSLRLLDDAGNDVHWPDGTLNQDRFPLRQVANSDQWLAGELVRDVHYARLPTDVEPHHAQVIIYDASTVAEVGRWQVALPAYW